MSRHARVVTVREPPDLRPGAATRPWPVSATATLAWVSCSCGETVSTVVRPWETTGDVVDAMLRAAGWDSARDLCPGCIASEELLDALRCSECGDLWGHTSACPRGAR